MFNRNSKIKKYTNSDLFEELTANIGNDSIKSHNGNTNSHTSNRLFSKNEDSYTITSIFRKTKESTESLDDFMNYEFNA